MRALAIGVITLLIGLAGTGCGGTNLNKTKGRITKNGQALVLEKGASLRVTFVPVVSGSARAQNYYAADVDNEKGTFVASGPDHKGVPPGKYRVAVELMQNKKDTLKGRYDTDNSPFVFDVDSKTKEIVIDLDKLPTAQGS